MDSINDDQKERTQAFVTLSLSVVEDKRPTALKAKVDTGAQANILPLRIYRQMDLPENSLKPSTTMLVSYTGTPIPQHGICSLSCTFKDETKVTDFFVTEEPGPAIIGLPSFEEFGIVTLNCEIAKELPRIKDTEDLIRQYLECFQGIGKFDGQYHITVDPAVPSVVHPPRRVPFKMKEDIKQELSEMEQQGIITPVREGKPTAWVNSLEYHRKPSGKIRVCLDPKDLNKAILRDHHVTPTLEDILPLFKDATYFSIVDAKSRYGNVELDEESSYLTTFNSPFGRYRFLRMPFGLKMSQDVFQSKIEQLMEGCVGTTGIADDMIVYAETEEEHDRRLHGLRRRCAEKGLNLNPEKCNIKQQEIKFYGVICGNDGVKPNPKKVTALKQMSTPRNRQEQLSVLGLATYLLMFVQNLSGLSTTLRELTRKNVTFQWSDEHQEAFEAIKEAVSGEVTLNYFNPQKPITLQVDTSMAGLSAVLFQEDRPVVFGCERFYNFLFGQDFIVESDHKPLESIHLKHLSSAPARLRRMLLRLQPYTMVIKYKPGREVAVADALSRLPIEDTDAIPNLEAQIHDVQSQFSTEILSRIKSETAKDAEFNVLREVIYTGWQEARSEAPSPSRPYWNHRDELSIEDGLIVKGKRIVIPASMTKEILEKLHAAHQGAEKMKLRARSAVFWDGINKDRSGRQPLHRVSGGTTKANPRRTRTDRHPAVRMAHRRC